MARIDNLTNFLTDIGDAIRTKKGIAGEIPANTFDTEILSIPGVTSSPYTGSVDRVGLKSIGWSDTDIDYYQEHGVNWNKEDDNNYKVTAYETNAYKSMNGSNIATYLPNLQWFPNVDIFSEGTMPCSLDYAPNLKGLPTFDKLSPDRSNTFTLDYCPEITTIPPDLINNNRIIRCKYLSSLQYLPNVNMDSSLTFQASKMKKLELTYNPENITMSYLCKDNPEIEEVIIHAPDSNMTHINNCCAYCSKLKNVILDFDMTKMINIDNSFIGCDLSILPIPDDIELSSLISMTSAFAYNNIEIFKMIGLSSVNSIVNVLYYSNKLKSVTLHGLNPNITIAMTSAFSSCSELTDIDFGNETLTVSNISSIYDSCTKLINPWTNFTIDPEATNSAVNSMFVSCSELVTIPPMDISNAKYVGTIINNCQKLVTIEGILDVSGNTSKESSYVSVISNCANLENVKIHGVKNRIGLSGLDKLSHESLMYMINNAATVTPGLKMTLGSINYAKLTSEEIKIATDKGWTVTA